MVSHGVTERDVGQAMLAINDKWTIKRMIGECIEKVRNRPARWFIHHERLAGGIAAINDELRSRRKAGLVGRQEQNAFRNFLGFPETLHRRSCREALSPFAGTVRHRRKHTRVDIAGMDGIDPDRYLEIGGPTAADFVKAAPRPWTHYRPRQSPHRLAP